MCQLRIFTRNEKDSSSNWWNGLGEDNKNENSEYEEEMVIQNKKEMDCAIFQDVNHDRVNERNHKKKGKGRR